MLTIHLLVVFLANVPTAFTQWSWFPFFHGFLTVDGQNVCKQYFSIRQKYYTDCGFWHWQACTRYKSVVTFRTVCCNGYSSDNDRLRTCPYAICASLINPHGACNQYFPDDKIIYRPGKSTDRGISYGGGTCDRPGVCKDCNSGFYSNNGKCTICPKIKNCLHRECTSATEYRCSYCDGEIIDEHKQYWRAYIRGINNNYKECIKACSWRSDSTRCYPGHCTDNDKESSCKCMEGFGGYQCDEIIRDSTISYALGKLKGPGNTDPVESPVNPNEPLKSETKWTNQNVILTAEINVKAVFKSNETAAPPDPSARNHFVTEFEYGIIKGEVRLSFVRDSDANFTLPPIVKSCPTKSRRPTTDIYICNNTVQLNGHPVWGVLSSFSHDDRVIFSYSVTNGGRLRYVNRDDYRDISHAFKTNEVILKGRTVYREFTFHWDLENPYHKCLQDNGMNCSYPPVNADDVSNKSDIHMKWSGWTDDLSGVERYQYELYKLNNLGSELTEGDKVKDGIINSSKDGDMVLNVTSPGMFSLVFYTIDRAGNDKAARTVFLYDDASKVETIPGKFIRVKQSTQETMYAWIVVDDQNLEVLWKGKFKNEIHHKNNWLEQIRKYPKVDVEYDDRYGKRTSSAVPHRQGVTRFETYFVALSPTITQQQSFKETENVLDESTILSVNWMDGDRLDITVRAFDILDVYADDTITVYKDTSPPVIENLWLSNGGRENVSVHNVEDFTKMTIEWNAYDYHSGLESLEWKLFDNYTKQEVLHGHANLHAQGNTMNISECQEKYHDAPRGPECYCTTFHGCFHKHFFVIPKINDHSGLLVGKDKGVHDSDYYIEVTITNKAKLRTILSKKITIDISPPHEGSVHDGLRGDPELDFQQDLNLNSHWDGFFDRESGVEFYRYIFGDKCFSDKDFKNSTQSTETYNTYASYLAPKEGTYYVSVVAVNRAQENSKVVCSDGVTITTEVPQVKDFVLSGAKTRPRMVTENGMMWYLDSVLRRHAVSNSSFPCSSLTSVNVSVLPEGTSMPEINSSNCYMSKDLHLLAVLHREAQFKMSWGSNVDSSLIHDYEVGLSSTAGSMAPDIVFFRSTKHHTHFRINHPDVPDGQEFFIVIKSISKSGVEGIQSIGPFIMDTSIPTFVGDKLEVNLFNGFLVANWSADAFEDPDDPYPMSFQFAIGHQPQFYDVCPFEDLSYGGPCKPTVPSTCTAIPISKFKWSLHGHHQYYVTLKATNLAGLSVYQTSEPYMHDVQLPAEGIVFDLPVNSSSVMLNDIKDIDFTTENSRLSFEWSGFFHPHQTIVYRACVGTRPNICDVTNFEPLSALEQKHMFTGLHLQSFKVYFVTIEASTSAGSVLASTDGIRVLDVNKNLTGVVVQNGNNCSVAEELKTQHHERDTRPTCKENIEYQSSVTSMDVYWNIPDTYKPFIREAWIQIDRNLVDDVWVKFMDFQYIGRHSYVTLVNLNLQPGITYRPVLKLCAEDICFPEIYGTPLTILVNRPVGGNISVSLSDDQLNVQLERMIDPDIKEYKEAANAVDVYEWAIGDGVGIHTLWHMLENVTVAEQTQIQFSIPLNGTIDFSKCRKIFIRSYNKVGIWTIIHKEIKACKTDDDSALILPKIVIDAIGEQETSLDGVIRDGYGKDIYLETNGRWDKADVDYTPFKNVISATWPLLRHHNYTWAVIDAENMDVTSYYKDEKTLQLSDPCSHPDAIKCGQTDKEYINVFFKSQEELVHGKRYLVCIHAPEMVIEYEKWTEKLNEVRSCSDGVTVDLTPPTPGFVWIGIDPSKKYMSSTSDIFMSWESFTDIEEYGKTQHSSGIKEYFVGVGSTDGGTDIYPYTSVGLVNHFTITGLRLQDGHEYYATVKAKDFAGRDSTATSHPIKVDSSPPEVSKQPITIKGRHLTNFNEIDACWRDVFLDPESGIDYYLWGVGSNPGHDDIVSFSKTELDCGVSSEDKIINIDEGHAYFVTVKSINRAGLITTSSSWAFIYDMSAPVPGHVYDGSESKVPTYAKDIDYQTDAKTLSSYWEGFHDPHSTIKAYYVSIGTCPKCEDVLTNQDIGISYNFTLCHIHLGYGIRYYTTVTACNTAELCTSVTSDGVVIDNSPPLQGIVLDGVGSSDVEYQSLRNYISARWFGFIDPQSGMDHFTWRAGTRPGLDDIVKQTHLHVTDILVEPGLPSQLPVGKRIYITIAAFNKAGLSTEASSNGFIVDETPPVIKVRPYVSPDLGSIKDDSLVFPNTIRVKWEVDDPESYIQRQYLSISSHKGGYFNASSTEINGIVREYTFTRLDLHDGGSYIVKLIVCNGAKICVEEESREIKIDSSPPTPGMFAIHTDHAANLHRHIDGWMTWSRYKLWLSWLGFSDIHTGIDKYYVSVGSRYMTDDLNKIPGSPQEFLHNQSGIDKQDEGFVQTFEVDVKNLAKFEHVFVSVWAINNVGLPSMMIHSQFKLVPGGSLELIRRCSTVTCKGHCVCAAQGQRCSLNGDTCQDISLSNHNTIIAVYDITDVRPTSPFADINYTPSNVALAVKWHIVQAHGLKPLWYEWSAGLTKSTVIEGILSNSDNVWSHAGQNSEAILNLEKGKILKEPGVAYSMIVRAWYSDYVYADFKTDGVCVLSTNLSRRKLKGTAVVEQIPGHWKKEVDYIRAGAPFTSKWTNVFKDDVNIIERFKVYLSTYPGGHDIHAVELDLPGTVTSHNISRVPLTPGIVYYSNVVGYSLSGIHATESSDGIMIDSQPPVAGTVKDGIGIYDIDYQNSSRVVSASWHGFSDRDSGISHYMWCVQTISSTDDICDIWDWENVGIQRSVSRTLNTSLILGTEYESVVYAVDIIGQKSETAKSNGVMVDTTYPEPTSMEHLEENIALNPSFEDFDSAPREWDGIANNTDICRNASQSKPRHWTVTNGSCLEVFKSGKNVAMDGRAFLFVVGEVSQTLSNLKINTLYRLTFVTAHPPILGAVLANKEGYVELGGKRHVFIVYTREDKHASSSRDLNWHYHTFYFRAYQLEVVIKLGSMVGNSGILFDDVKLQETTLHDFNPQNSNGKTIHAHVTSLHQWSSIHASWSFMDAESPLVEYMWAIGYTEGSTEVQGFKSVGLNNFAYNYNVTLAHTSVIHITVVATNAAGLRREAHAEDLLVDLTPPEIVYINDGIEEMKTIGTKVPQISVHVKPQGADIAAQTTEEISANWEVHDFESGLEHCEWAVGLQPYGNEIQAFQKLAQDTNTISRVFPMSQLFTKMVHVTLRCRNKAGLQTSLSTDGVKVSNLPPNTTHAEVEVMPQSITEYSARNFHQGDTSTFRLKWTGYYDVTGIDSYMFTVENQEKKIFLEKSITAEEQDTSFCIINGIDLDAGNYTTSIKAVNKMYLRSPPVKSMVVVSSDIPSLAGTSNLKMTMTNRTVSASWTDHFVSSDPMFYEVSAGTTLGGADIIQWQETKNTFLEFNLPPKIKFVQHITAYVTIRGVASNGMNTVFNDVVKLI